MRVSHSRWRSWCVRVSYVLQRDTWASEKQPGHRMCFHNAVINLAIDTRSEHFGFLSHEVNIRPSLQGKPSIQRSLALLSQQAGVYEAKLHGCYQHHCCQSVRYHKVLIAARIYHDTSASLFGGSLSVTLTPIDRDILFQACKGPLALRLPVTDDFMTIYRQKCRWSDVYMLLNCFLVQYIPSPFALFSLHLSALYCWASRVQGVSRDLLLWRGQKTCWWEPGDWTSISVAGNVLKELWTDSNLVLMLGECITADNHH